MLGIDFGTSNTAAGIMAGDRVFLIEVEQGKTTLPTSVFFDYARRATLYGSVANAALIDGREGRFMRALKSVLGTPIMREKRRIAHENTTLIEVVAKFLERIRERAETTTGMVFETALSGRPVQFHSTDMERNAQAEADLRDAYLLAGFKDVTFMFEPEAAALASGSIGNGEIGLIVDIGGGTSDFSLFERDGDGIRVIASHGVRVGGTDFDKAINLAHVMPLLGRGSEIKNELGDGTHTAPNRIFNDLSSWEKIPFLYTAETRNMAAIFKRLGVEKAPFSRLHEVLEMELGHDISFAVERGKIRLNDPNETEARIDLRVIEPQLWAQVTALQMSAALHEHATKIRTCAQQILAQADIAPHRVTKVVLVGGSSLMQVVKAEISTLFPQARLEQGDAFTAVADGLAMAAQGA